MNAKQSRMLRKTNATKRDIDFFKSMPHEIKGGFTKEYKSNNKMISVSFKAICGIKIYE
jgi:hypothetical protein